MTENDNPIEKDQEAIHSELETAPKRKSFLTKIVSLLGVAILIIIILGSSFALLQANRRAVNAVGFLNWQFQGLQQKLDDMQVAMQDVTHRNDEVVLLTKNMLKTQADAMSAFQKENHTNKNTIWIDESIYLVKLANDSLQYENNIAQATKLLQAADQNIVKIADPKAYPVREAIAADLVTLQSTQQLDKAGVFARLAALNEQIDKLPLMRQFNSPPNKEAEINAETGPWWRRALNSMEEALKRIVVIRHDVPHQLPFIAPEQQIYLYQNLHAELEKAEWGLLHQEPTIYRMSLLQASNWIKQYALQDSLITQQLLKSLSELQQINIKPNVPNLEKSLQALQNYESSSSNKE